MSHSGRRRIAKESASGVGHRIEGVDRPVKRTLLSAEEVEFIRECVLNRPDLYPRQVNALRFREFGVDRAEMTIRRRMEQVKKEIEEEGDSNA